MTTVEIIFKRSMLDVVKNLFRPKAKRFPAVARFENVLACDVLNGAVLVRFNGPVGGVYYYPLHKVDRVNKTE